MIYKDIFLFNILLIISLSDLKLVSGGPRKNQLTKRGKNDFRKLTLRVGDDDGVVTIKCTGLDCMKSYESRLLRRVDETFALLTEECISKDRETILASYRKLDAEIRDFTKFARENIETCLKNGCGASTSELIRDHWQRVADNSAAAYKETLSKMSDDCENRSKVECYDKDIRRILDFMLDYLQRMADGEIVNKEFKDENKCTKL